MVRCINYVITTLFLGSCLSGCGKFGPPLAPELLAPKAVEDLTVTAADNGVTFEWVGSDTDERGKELTSMNGFRIRRKAIVNRGDETDPDIDFDPIGYVSDNHVVVRDKLREEARAEGRVGRRIEAPGEDKHFTYTDTTLAKDKTYIYQIVPENQGDVEGLIKQVVKITFKGTASDIAILDSGDLEEEGGGGAKTSTKR